MLLRLNPALLLLNGSLLLLLLLLERLLMLNLHLLVLLQGFVLAALCILLPGQVSLLA